MWNKISELLLKSCIVIVLGSMSSVSLANEHRLGDGSILDFTDLGFRLSVPKSWQILGPQNGKSLVIKEALSPTNTSGSARQISVLQSYETIQMDEAQVERLRREITATHQEAENFQIADEIKFFNFRSENDGIVAYSYLQKNGQAFSQMHILLGGENNRILLTAIETTEDFNKNMEENWQTMTSIEITGPAPDFLMKWRPAFVAALGLIVGFFALSLLRRWRVRRWLKLADVAAENSADQSEQPSLSSLVPLAISDKPSATPPLPKVEKTTRQVKTVNQAKKLPAKPRTPSSKLAKPASIPSANFRVKPKKQALPPPPPAKQAVAQHYDANWDDDWQWVSGHDEVF
ncbi:MAG: hypothetical protein ACOH5I_02375 [Oligoflexus sp.]